MVFQQTNIPTLCARHKMRVCGLIFVRYATLRRSGGSSLLLYRVAGQSYAEFLEYLTVNL